MQIIWFQMRICDFNYLARVLHYHAHLQLPSRYDINTTNMSSMLYNCFLTRHQQYISMIQSIVAFAWLATNPHQIALLVYHSSATHWVTVPGIFAVEMESQPGAAADYLAQPLTMAKQLLCSKHAGIDKRLERTEIYSTKKTAAKPFCCKQAFNPAAEENPEATDIRAVPFPTYNFLSMNLSQMWCKASHLFYPSAEK